MRNLLRLIVPQPVRYGIRKVQYRVGCAAAESVIKMMGLFHVSYRAKAKEGFTVVAKMDYARHPIWLNVDSEVEYSMRLRSCDKEPETVEWIEKFVKPGDILYDIGANVGAYSLVANKFSGGKAKVYAFEPSFSTFAQLSKNIFLNRCSSEVIPLYVALSEKSGIETFNYSSLSPGIALHALGNTIDNKGNAFTPVFSQPVISYTLDEFIERFAIEPPTHIKLDVDGHEWPILKGAAKTLALPSVKSVLVELEPMLENYRPILDFFEAKGFKIHSKHSHGQGRPEDTCNFCFVKA